MKIHSLDRIASIESFEIFSTFHLYSQPNIKYTTGLTKIRDGWYVDSTGLLNIYQGNSSVIKNAVQNTKILLRMSC
jgi:hypothetical protein